MELFPAQPDLSLQISLPSSSSHEPLDLGFWTKALDSSNKNTKTTTTTTTKNTITSSSNNNAAGFSLSLANPSSSDHHSAASTSNIAPLQHHLHHFQHQEAIKYHQDLGLMKPIRGIPVYHSAPHNSYIFTSNNYHSYQQKQQHCEISRSRFFSRFPGRRSMRAPRMRWTTTLHARFVHAVELLGGHERATPKSVLELMDVKDLTLAHVKSHLQMYRTVKTTDRPSSSSGQNDAIEISDDNLLDIRGPEPSVQSGRSTDQNGSSYYGLWSNSSRESWFHDKPIDTTAGSQATFQNGVQSKSIEMANGVKSSCKLMSEPSTKKPNLEFTLGRPH